MRNVGVLGVVVLSLSFLTTPVFAGVVEGQGARDPMTVSGVVTKVHSGMVFVKTPRGQVTFAPNVLAGLQVGEQVEMQVNRSHAVIDAHRVNPPAIPEPGLIF